MEIISVITDKTKRKIRLTKERWLHIAKEHPNLTDRLEDIRNTIVKPVKIKSSKYDESVGYYYKQDKSKSKYLFVSVKYLNGTGYIITAFYVKKISK